MQTTSLASGQSLQGATAYLAGELQAGRVYRREDLARISNAVDRHMRDLVSKGVLNKLAQGLYYVPKQSSYGPLPPSDEEVVRGFLREKNFLVFSPSSYNAVGLGTTQLYKSTLVYNHKRHGVFKLGNREFDFRVKPRFPKKLTPEFLFVDLLNNLNELPEDRESVLQQAQNKLATFDSARLKLALNSFGSMTTRKRVRGWLRGCIYS